MEETHQHRPVGWHTSHLPFWIAIAAFALLAFTLNRWVSILSLSTLVQAAGWDWLPSAFQPLNYAIALPVRLLPAGVQPFVLNLISAACAAVTVGLLARSIILLPHDRTREQRHAELSEHSLLSTPNGWLPPLLGALVGLLELTFWEHATSFSGEMLDLLIFAFCIWSLLEFRIDQRESRLTRMAFVYGLGVTNNFAMIGFFPAFLVALIWIRGKRFFNARFILRSLACGLVGLSLYLLLPAVGSLGDSPFTFWQLLKGNLVAQKSGLVFGYYMRFYVFLLGLTALVPMLVMGIRWPSSFGETSGTGDTLTKLAFYLVHALFLVVCIFVAFDTGFSPRTQGRGLPFLTFYYLGALSVGYFSGYFVAVFHPRSKRSYGQPSIGEALGRHVVNVAIFGALFGVPAGLVYKNFPVIRTTNGPVLREFVRTKVAKLPAAGAVVLADDPVNLRLVEAELRATGREKDYVLANTALLNYPAYHRFLAQLPGSRWLAPATNKEALAQFDSPHLINTLIDVARSNAVYYLHPSFGYYFEAFHLVPHGLVYELKPYGPNVVGPPTLGVEAIRENAEFWGQMGPPLIDIAAHVDPRNTTLTALGRNYSLALNYWAVELQRTGDLATAGKGFDLALRLNRENPSATLNLEFNSQMQKGKAAQFQLVKSVENRFVTSWDRALGNGGPVDEPGILMRLGYIFANNFQPRQAAVNFQRATQLQPGNVEPQLALIGTLIYGQMAEQALQMVADLKKAGRPMTVAQQIELVRLEARALHTEGDLAAAEKLLRSAQPRFPQDDSLLDALSQLYLLSARFKESLGVLDEQLKLAPDNVRALLNKGAIAIQLHDYATAIPPLSRVLEIQPQNAAARMNRAIALLQTGQLDDAKADYDLVLGMMPKQFAIHYGLGEIAYRKQNFEAALGHYQAYLRLAPPQNEESAVIRKRVEEIEKRGIKGGNRAGSEIASPDHKVPRF